MIGPRVKICGITREMDAQLAVELGADAIGFVFWPASPRAVSPAAAAVIANRLPEGVTRVGVFVGATPAQVSEAVRIAALDAAQLHGDEDVAAFADCGVALIKALALHDQYSYAGAATVPDAVTVLVDAHAPVERGGTGLMANWAAAARLAASRPIVLAGGLNAANVVAAIDCVRPWAIDVSSGVEDAPGLKNPDKMRALFATLGKNGRDGRGLIPR